MNRRFWLFLMVMICFAAIAMSLFIGSTWIPASTVVAAIAGQAAGPETTIIHSIRLPRALVAAIVGAGLGAAGATLQGFTRNPLAAPGLLGFSACAALGAVLALYFNFPNFVTPTALSLIHI